MHAVRAAVVDDIADHERLRAACTPVVQIGAAFSPKCAPSTEKLTNAPLRDKLARITSVMLTGADSSPMKCAVATGKPLLSVKFKSPDNCAWATLLSKNTTEQADVTSGRAQAGDVW